jgi:1-acyl-sn-glycerol-3-phosphate acyltransferase
MATSRRSAYRPYNPRWFNRLLRLSYGIYLSRRFRIHCVGKELFDTLKPPFVIIPNHVAMLDSLMVGSNVPQPIYWIASDGNMRTTIMRFLLKLVGTIPKSKYIPDLETINGMVEVVRKRKGVIGIFPEGTATFDGHTQDLVPATGKLLKLLKVPVVSAIVKGAYYSMPRWSWTNRFGRVEIEFKLVFSSDELSQLKADEVLAQLRKALDHDEAAWQQERQIPFSGKTRAEGLETVLFHCPSCGNSESLRSSGPRLACEACGASWYLNRYYHLHPENSHGGTKSLQTIRDWNLWQAAAFSADLLQLLHSQGKNQALFAEGRASIFVGRKLNPLRRLRTGRLVLYPDRLELQTGERTDGQSDGPALHESINLTAGHSTVMTESNKAGPLCFPLGDIEGEGIFKRNMLEFYHGRNLYQIRFPDPGASALKWLLAFGILRKLDREEQPALG